MGFRIRKWEKYQHYKTLNNRNPPAWIKLHKDLLDKPEWHALPPAAAKALVGLWLVASERNGELPASDVLAFRLRIASDEMTNILKSLHDNGFLEGASEPLAGRYQSASTEKEEKKKRTLLVHGDAPTDEWPAKPKRNGKGYDYPQLFEVAWEGYPKRQGSNPKTGAYRAFRARVKAGDDPNDLIASARNYRTHCQAAGKEGTEFVKQAATFWGPNEAWRDFIEGDDESDSFVRSELDRWNQLVADTRSEDAA